MKMGEATYPGTLGGTSAVAQRCKGCSLALKQTYQYVYVDAPVPPGSCAFRYTVLDGPFCDDCANRRRAK